VGTWVVALQAGGVDNALRALKALGDDIARKETPGLLNAMAKPIEDEMVARCPVGETANLVNSIWITTHKKGDHGYYVLVGPRAPHAHLIHLGHDVRVPRKGYGGKLQYWGKYWAKKMHGQFIPGKRAQANPFVAVAAEARAGAAIDAGADHVHAIIKKYESKDPRLRN